MILCNKSDKKGAVSTHAVAKSLELSSFRKDRTADVEVFAVSALKNEGLKTSIQWLVKESMKLPDPPG